MIWNDHSRDVPAGAHAFLGASKHSWTEKEEADILTAFKNSYSTTMGTEIHEIASFMINKKIRLAKTDRKLIFYELLKNGLPRFVIQSEKIIETVMPFINDAIGFDMQSEQPLYFSRWAFG